jgi:signal transduction histidine kinase
LREGRAAAAGNKAFSKRGIIWKCSVLLTLLVTAFGVLAAPPALAEPIRAVDGLLDLRNAKLDEESVAIRLDGEWDFYWRQLLRPEDFYYDTPKQRLAVFVPAPWNDAALSGEPLPGFGYGTYRLVVYTPPGSESLALRFSAPRTAHRLWINGRLLSSAGIVSDRPENSEARYFNRIIPLRDGNGSLEIVLQVSNYLHHKGGLRRSIELGAAARLRQEFDTANAASLAMFGVFVTLGITNLAFFFTRRRERAALFFALFMLLTSLRTVTAEKTTGTLMALMLEPDLPQALLLRVEYLSIFSLTLYIFFVAAMLPELLPRRFLRGVAAGSLGFAAVFLLAPVWFFSRHLGIVNLFFAGALLYMLYRLLLAAWADGLEPRILLTGHILMLVAILNDQLFYADLIQTGNYYYWGFLVVAISHALLVLRRFAAAFDAVESLNRRLDETNRFKDDFLAEVSHELLTPVHGMRGLLESIRDSAVVRLNRREKQTLDTVIGINQRLTTMVADIQDFLRLRQRDLVFHPESVNLHGVIELTIATCRVLVDDKPLTIVNAAPPEIFVWCDRSKLQQILLNLTENAVKYTPAGGVTLGAADGEKVAVWVEDTGIGIPAEEQQRIFEPYARVDDSPDSPYHGSGLGLSVVKRLVELQGGRIDVASRAGEGSRFTFTLPRANPGTTADSPDWPDTPPIFPGTPPPETATVLIVDDEPVNLEVLEQHFRDEPYRIVRAASGRQALAWIGQQPFDLVVLDLMMPDLSGYEVCREIRERFNLLELPVLILTVRNRPSDIVLALSTGANDYLAKPFEKQELLARVSTLILMKRSLQEAVQSQRESLLAQIKPHFFYNVMNTIMGFCLTDPERAYELLGDFSRLIRQRLSLSEGRQYISLREELDLVRAYLKIEQARFGDVLACDIRCEVDDSLSIPPLLLEPIVENAVKHGVHEKTGGGRVTVEILPEGEEIAFRVSDNGVGITAERLREVLADGASGIGLRNIRRRLQLEYRRTLRITSRPGEGTTVWFSLPQPAGTGSEINTGGGSPHDPSIAGR